MFYPLPPCIGSVRFKEAGDTSAERRHSTSISLRKDLNCGLRSSDRKPRGTRFVIAVLKIKERCVVPGLEAAYVGVVVILHQLGRVAHPRNPNMHVPIPELRVRSFLDGIGSDSLPRRTSVRSIRHNFSGADGWGEERVAFRCAFLTEKRS